MRLLSLAYPRRAPRNWDDIPEYDIDEEDALDKVMGFAAGVYTRAAEAVEAMQPESQSEDEAAEEEAESAKSEAGGEVNSESG